MRRKVPKKNIEPVLVDIKKPGFNYSHLAKFGAVNLAKYSFWQRKISFRSPFRGIAVLALVFLIAVGGVFFVGFKSIKEEVVERADFVADNFVSSLKAAKDFDIAGVGDSLKKNRQELSEIDRTLSREPVSLLLNAASKFVPSIKDTGSFLKDLGALNLNLIVLTDLVSDLQHNWFGYFRNNGPALVEKINTIKKLNNDIRSNIENLRNRSDSLNKLSDFDKFNRMVEGYYVKYSSNLYALDEFLDGILDILDSDREKKILLLFQNYSEIRPAGGFLGSYGVLTVKNGQMVGLDVGDIYWPDHPMNFDLKLIPPEPLQYITTDWGARDANWFFNFPTSAEAVISLLQSSKIYKENNIKFEGAIAVNVKVLKSILKITGPIYLEDYDLEINEDNFLVELQREVEAGRDKKKGDNPKKVLAYLAPLIMKRLDNLSVEEAAYLLEAVNDHIKYKDIMFYFKDRRIANLLREYGLDGSVYSIPLGFWGSYLAVVDANIAGGKTDAFIKQDIQWSIDVASDGGIINDVLVKRIHQGGQEKDYWYNVLNKNYIKIFTNSDSTLLFMEGNDYIKPVRRDYNALGNYKKYPALEEIEDTKVFVKNFNVWYTKEFGKNVFSTWFNAPPGKEKNLKMRYSIPPPNRKVVEEGEVFKLVFDRQSGVNTSLKIFITAPVGYIWAEAGEPTFVYTTDKPTKRINIELTLKKREW